MFGYVRVAAGVPKSSVSGVGRNAEEIISLIEEARCIGVDVIVFPELCVTGAACLDLFFNSALTEKALEALTEIAGYTDGITAVVGLPIRHNNALYNCAAVLSGGEIAGIVPKDTPPSRWFSAYDGLGERLFIGGRYVNFGKYVFSAGNYFTLGITFSDDYMSPSPQSTGAAFSGSDIICCLSAEKELAYLKNKRICGIKQLSERICASYVYCCAGIAESTAEGSRSGHTLIAEAGELLFEGGFFSKENTLIYADTDMELLRNRRIKISFPDNRGYEILALNHEPSEKSDIKRIYTKNPFLPKHSSDAEQYYRDIFNIQFAGLYKKLDQTGIKKCVVGVSGGLDSALALVSMVKAFDFAGLPRENIIAVSMPGFGTSGRTYNNSIKLMRDMCVTARVISIKDACMQHFTDIGLGADYRGVAYENAQARERTQILMDIANVENALVIGTGDLSEAALGFCTYNGDQMSMYNLNGGVPKTMIPHLLRYAAENEFTDCGDILLDIVNTPISPELLPLDESNEISQLTESIVGPYELHDFFLYHFLKNNFAPDKIAFIARHTFADDYNSDVIDNWLRQFLRRFFTSQFKRQASPDSPQIFDINLSPRGGYEMSCDADYSEWI